MQIQFDLRNVPPEILEGILNRALKTDPEDRIALSMDLAAVNAHTPLDFERLLAFPDFDFIHDIAGIQRHIDRSTGKLTEFFVPHCTRKDS